MKQQDVFAVANFFLEKNDHSLDNLKLNKIVYISLGFSLGLNSFDLFEEEVQAWRFGPVIPELYHHFKERRASTINNLAGIYRAPKINDLIEPEIDKEEIEILKTLETVWVIYKGETGLDFIEMTHQKGTPWDKYYDGRKNKVIDREFIEAYYKFFIKNAREYGKK